MSTIQTTSAINKDRLFIGSCFALITTAFSFSIRAGILSQLGTEYGFSGEQLGVINSMWFLGFPLAMLFFGIFYNAIGPKRIMQFAFLTHTLGILLTIYSGGSYITLLISTLLIGIGNGCTEAACNPMIADSYEGAEMNSKMNKFHMWFPGGIVIGSLISEFMGKNGLNLPWQAQIWIILIPAMIYAYLYFGQTFPSPKQGREGLLSKSSAILPLGIGGGLLFGMYLLEKIPFGLNPIMILVIAMILISIAVYLQFGIMFLIIFLCMALTAISEFGPQQWTGLVLNKSGANPMFLLALTTGTMAVARYFGGPIIHKFDHAGVLWVSAILAVIGLFMYSTMTGPILYLAAFIFACGIAYFWPNMIGYVADKIPSAGALGMSLVGAIGMFSTSIFQPIIGKWIDSAKVVSTASGLTGDAMELAAGQATISKMITFPLILVFAFGVLFFMTKRSKATN